MGKKLYEFSNVQIKNLLDLTDASTLEKLGTTFEQIKKMDPVNAIQYEFTHEIAIWAKNNGYSGIKFPGTQGTPDYVNFVIFEQETVNKSIKGTVKPIPW